MAIGDAMVAPAGLQNQMYGQPTRVPGYDQGLSQAPGQMALPPEPMPIGRPTAVVGGPAYFTPQGYNAPPQPTQAFMPTDVRPDPIGQQFMRQMESPMGQQFQQQYEATQAPIREAEAAARAEAQAAQDARFQEMMDRIAELEGQLATPTPSPVPEPEPFIPGGPFPGIPDFIRDLDFSGLPNFDIDYDDLMDQYRDRMEMGEPEPIESFVMPNPRDLPPASTMPVDEPIFTNMRENMPPPVRFKMPELPDFQSPVVPTPAPAPVMPTAPINIPNIPNIPNIDFSSLPKFEMPEITKPVIGGKPMIPSFGRSVLR
jgi:hypothetical protein